MDVFVDGSCLNNGQPNAVGGWSFVVVDNDKSIKQSYGKLRHGKQTNNRAELEALLQALIWFDSQDTADKINIYCDSELVVQGLNGESTRNANRDIWEQIEELCIRHVGKIRPIDVTAHKGSSKKYEHRWNCIADRLARKGANSLILAPIKIKSKELA